MGSRKLLESIWNHPAGPKTIHFWAPTFKWSLSATNIFNFSNPPESVSYHQQAAFAVAGFIGARYCMVITPRNWNLFSNNFALGCTGIYQLVRKSHYDYFGTGGPNGEIGTADHDGEGLTSSSDEES